MMKVPLGDKDLNLVWVFREIGTLSNVLYALAMFKKELGELWPSEIHLHKDSRMTFGLGGDTKVTCHRSGVMVGALYLSTYHPKADVYDGVRTATKAIERMASGCMYRDRRMVRDE